MANGKRPAYDVFVSTKGKDDKNFYHKVGAAWTVSNDGLSIKLFAIPTSGELICFPPKDD